MEIQEQVSRDAFVWTVPSRFTTHDVGELWTGALDQAAGRRSRRLVVDMACVVLMDAGGVGELVRLYKAATERRIAITLVNVPARVQKLLAITGLADALNARQSSSSRSTSSRQLPSCGSPTSARRTSS